MRIFGIDPGTATTGFAVIEKEHSNLTVLDYGVIVTSKKLTFPDRCVELVNDLRVLIKTHEPDLVAIESLFFFKNQKTAFAVAQARGAMVCAVAEMGISICEPTPLQVKQAVSGYGRADKKQVQKMVQQIYSLDEIPKPDDAADALAVAFTVS